MLKGHHDIVKLLHRLATNEHLAPILVTGPTGVGKRTLLLEHARMLMCVDAQAPIKPCNHCMSCLAWHSDDHPDITYLGRDRSIDTIGIDAVREFQIALRSTSWSGARRTGVIINAERLSEQAQQALLKIFEESPIQLLMTTLHPLSILDTLRSRCIVLEAREFSQNMLMQFLKNEFPTNMRDELTVDARGSYGVLVTWANNGTARADFIKLKRFLNTITMLPLHEQMVEFEVLFHEQYSHEIPVVLQIWRNVLQRLCRDALIESKTAVPIDTLILMIERLSHGTSHLNFHVQSRTLMEEIVL